MRKRHAYGIGIGVVVTESNGPSGKDQAVYIYRIPRRSDMCIRLGFCYSISNASNQLGSLDLQSHSMMVSSGLAPCAHNQ